MRVPRNFPAVLPKSSKAKEIMKNQILMRFLFLLVLSTIILTTLPDQGLAATADQSEKNGYDLLTTGAEEIWGEDDVWLPAPTQWVQYEEDFGERSIVDFERGTVKVQLLIQQDDDPYSEPVIAHMRQGIRNLILRDAVDNVELIELRGESKKRMVADDSTQFSSRQTLHKKKKYSSHNLQLDVTPSPVTRDPVILDQLKMANGSKVTVASVEDFAAEKVTIKTIRAIKIKGKDGIYRQAVTVNFDLAPNHLEIRAQKYYPLVRSYAQRYDLDPSLIMAIIHTESMFNPRARSRVPAYGLMQLVPHTGALEAYHSLYGQKKSPSSNYLYNPENNIELGVVYFEILKNKYMKTIKDPDSRTYCAVAAYNAGASNVGRTFVSKKSMNMASPVVNTMKSDDVYSQLVEKSLSEETRKYVQKVLTRSILYSGWQ